MINYIFSNGLDISYSSNRIYDQTIKGTATNDKLCFGTIASTYVELVLDNTDGYFDAYSFKNGYINVYNEDKKKIRVYIDSVKERNRLITIKAYDAIIKLDKTWTPCKTPISLYEFINDICKQCDIKLNAFIVNNGGYNIQNVEELKGKTCRQCLSYALEICGFYGYIDSKERLSFKWFEFKNVQEIDITKLIDYNTDYENSIVDNIYFVRGSKVYFTNKNPKGSIYISKDNPLLKEASSSKVQDIINNLAYKVSMEYLPCTISAADYFTYNIGDVVKFTDYKSNERYAIVGTITYTGHNSCSITSVNVDEQDITTNETENSSSESSTITGSFSFYRKIENTDIEYKECSSDTEIEYFLNFNIEDAFDSLKVLVNNVPYKSYDVHNGNNTICLMLKGDIISDELTTIDIMTENELEDIEVNTIYRNCLVIDYDETDEPLDIGEVEVTIPNNYFFRGMNKLYFDNCIMGWRFKTDTLNIGIDNYNVETLYVENNEVTKTETDQNYSPEIHTQRMKDLYTDLRDGKLYFRLGVTGTFTDRDNNTYDYFDSPIDGNGGLIYKKTHKDKTEAYYKTTTGIVEIEDGDIIQFGLLCRNGKEPDWKQLDNWKLNIQNMNESIMNVAGVNTGYITINNFENGTLKILNPYLPPINSYPDKYNVYEKYIGNFYENNNLTNFEEDELEIDFTSSQLSYNRVFSYREFATDGYEKLTEINL